MLFPTHAIVGWLVARGLGLDRRATWLAVAGSLVPDLLDKPLGALTPLTLQSVAHSALGAAAVAGLVAATRLPRAVLWGWLAHLAADVAQLTVNARGPYAARMLAWPAVRPAPFVLADSPAARLGALKPLAATVGGLQVPILQSGYLAYYVGTPGFLLEVGVWTVVLIVVIARQRSVAT